MRGNYYAEALMSQHFEKVLKLLAEKRVEEAESYVTQTMEPTIEELEKERDLIVVMIDRVRNGSKPRLKLARRKLPKAERSVLIRKFAYDLAKEKGSWKVWASEVVAAISKAGHDLGTSVPGTMVGNVLFKDEHNWKRVEKGHFQYIGEKT